MALVAQVGDIVCFPNCILEDSSHCFHIVSGASKVSDSHKKVARVGDKISNGALIITGAPKASDERKPIARIGDKAYCEKCGIGYIKTGTSNLKEG